MKDCFKQSTKMATFSPKTFFFGESQLSVESVPFPHSQTVCDALDVQQGAAECRHEDFLTSVVKTPQRKHLPCL